MEKSTQSDVNQTLNNDTKRFTAKMLLNFAEF